MPLTELRMIDQVPRSDNYIFVLWAENFEEAPATIFVTELRKAGLRVKVVSLTHQQTSGVYGLALVPDLTLEQAMPFITQICCLIIPCSLRLAQNLKKDPRLHDFFEQLRSNQTRFVTGQLTGAPSDEFNFFSLSRSDITVYPDNEDLVSFARQVAHSLLTAI